MDVVSTSVLSGPHLSIPRPVETGALNGYLRASAPVDSAVEGIMGYFSLIRFRKS
jgi:hypothetical protein